MLSDWKALSRRMRQVSAGSHSDFPGRGDILGLKDSRLTDFKFCLEVSERTTAIATKCTVIGRRTLMVSRGHTIIVDLDDDRGSYQASGIAKL